MKVSLAQVLCKGMSSRARCDQSYCATRSARCTRHATVQRPRVRTRIQTLTRGSPTNCVDLSDIAGAVNQGTVLRMEQLVAVIAVVVFVLVHVFIDEMKFLSGTPRSRWLSVAGGVSVAYVFLHLIPELSEGQKTLAESFSAVHFAERHVYLIALAGLVVFYGLERLAAHSSDQDADGRPEQATSGGVFALHIASFAIYNVLIGYLLLHRERSSLQSLLFFALAMALHFVVTDYGLREHHKQRYNSVGRWVLSAAVLGGLALGFSLVVHEAMVAVLVAFLAGGVVLNVMKEELPKERESRFSAFVIGVVAYSFLLLAF